MSFFAYVECLYAGCRNAECLYVTNRVSHFCLIVCTKLSVFKPSVFMLVVVMLDVVMLSVFMLGIVILDAITLNVFFA